MKTVFYCAYLLLYCCTADYYLCENQCLVSAVKGADGENAAETDGFKFSIITQ